MPSLERKKISKFLQFLKKTSREMQLVRHIMDKENPKLLDIHDNAGHVTCSITSERFARKGKLGPKIKRE